MATAVYELLNGGDRLRKDGGLLTTDATTGGPKPQLQPCRLRDMGEQSGSRHAVSYIYLVRLCCSECIANSPSPTKLGAEAFLEKTLGALSALVHIRL